MRARVFRRSPARPASSSLCRREAGSREPKRTPRGGEGRADCRQPHAWVVGAHPREPGPGHRHRRGPAGTGARGAGPPVAARVGDRRRGRGRQRDAERADSGARTSARGARGTTRARRARGERPPGTPSSLRRPGAGPGHERGEAREPATLRRVHEGRSAVRARERLDPVGGGGHVRRERRLPARVRRRSARGRNAHGSGHRRARRGAGCEARTTGRSARS